MNRRECAGTIAVARPAPLTHPESEGGAPGAGVFPDIQRPQPPIPRFVRDRDEHYEAPIFPAGDVRRLDVAKPGVTCDLDLVGESRKGSVVSRFEPRQVYVASPRVGYLQVHLVRQ